MGCIRLENISESCTSLGTHLRLVKGNTCTSQEPQGLTKNQSFSDSQSYRYGFQGQEKDDEIKGEGNSYTTHFRQFDPRVGRWLSADPILHSEITPFNAFSNNPIIYVDPDGDTDYYSIKGKRIGSDDKDNGLKQIALRKSTVRIIKKATRKKQNISMNSNEHNDLIDLPTKSQIVEMDNVFIKTRETGREQGFAVGEMDGAEDKTYVKSGGTGSINLNSSIATLKDEGYGLKYTVHSHPCAIKSNSNAGDLTVSGNGPSPADQKFNEKFQPRQLDIVLGYNIPKDFNLLNPDDIENARKKPNSYVQTKKQYPRTITFFDSKSVTLKTDYVNFKRTVEKIRNDSTSSQSKNK